MRVRLLTKHFIEPKIYEAGTVLDYNGPINNDMEPMDDDARAAITAYQKDHPGATTNPVQQLPLTIAATVVYEQQQAGIESVSAPGGN